MTHIDEAFPSKYLSASDLKGQVLTVTIARFAVEEVGETKDEKYIFYFEGMPKGLVLNKTNGRRIAAIYGNELEGWIGKSIMLHPALTEYQGNEIECIRVKKEAPPPAVPTTPSPGDASPIATSGAELLAAMSPEQVEAVTAALAENNKGAGSNREKPATA